MRSTLYLLFLGVILITLALVVRSGLMLSKNPGEPINSAMRSALSETSPQLSTEDANRIRQLFPTAYTTKSGLMYVNRDPGSGGPFPRIGDMVTARYSGKFLDGSSFDSSPSFKFRLGTGMVIKGWDEAFLTMKRGARRTLIIPYWLAYGDVGHPPVIPPRTTLVFDVELVDFQ
jgi:FKBP-type peptidyl-prolyl cis-trans isomerase